MARKRRSSRDGSANLKVGSQNTRRRMNPGKILRQYSAKAVLFLIVAAVTGISIYIVTNPAVVTKRQNKPVYEAPSMPSSSPQAVTLESADVELFFSDPDSDLLVKERRNVVWKADDTENQIQAILAGLEEGSHNDLLTPIPAQVVIRGVSIKNGVALINFSQELIDNHPGGSLAEMHTIYAIVNSVLINMPALNKVSILVEGKSPETLKGHIDCRSPFTTNLAIVKKS